MAFSYKILFISRNSPLTQGILRRLKAVSDFGVSYLDDPARIVERLQTGEFHLLIFHFENIGQLQIKLIKEIRQLGCKIPALLLVDTYGEGEAYDLARTAKAVIQGTRNLNWDTELIGLSRRCMSSDVLSTRNAKRFSTIEVAQIINLDNGKTLSAQVADLSGTGARIIYTGSALRKGSKIRIQIALSQIGKLKILHGVVTWIKNGKDASKEAGVRFEKSQSTEVA